MASVSLLMRTKSIRPRVLRFASVLSRLLLLSSLLVTVSCANHITPPSRPAQPVRVILLDHGRHPSLMLPRDGDEWARYSYGEWRWYAEGRAAIWRVFPTMLWPTKGTLGRQLLTVDDMVRVDFVRIHTFTVSSGRVDRLMRDLDTVFEAGREQARYNPDFRAEFVPHPRSYSLFNQSNKVMAEWLRDLDCDVRGPLLYSTWRIVE